jgi:hypothetical protein
MGYWAINMTCFYPNFFAVWLILGKYGRIVSVQLRGLQKVALEMATIWWSCRRFMCQERGMPNGGAKDYKRNCKKPSAFSHALRL